jgi:dihydrofolate reductase
VEDAAGAHGVIEVLEGLVAEGKIRAYGASVDDPALRRIVVVGYVSLDGVIQAPGHSGEDPEGGFEHGGWTGPFMAEHRRYLSEEFQAAGAFLLGRVTYEIFAAYWPTVTDEENDIARALNSLPKYVASTTLNEAEWDGTVVIKSDVAKEVAKLK